MSNYECDAVIFILHKKYYFPYSNISLQLSQLIVQEKYCHKTHYDVQDLILDENIHSVVYTYPKTIVIASANFSLSYGNLLYNKNRPSDF